MPRRPKPIPPDPDGRNYERASWASEALGAFERITGTDHEDAVADLLCDLKHWCDRNNVSFVHELHRAYGMYHDETRAPEEPVTPVQVDTPHAGIYGPIDGIPEPPPEYEPPF